MLGMTGTYVAVNLRGEPLGWRDRGRPGRPRSDASLPGLEAEGESDTGCLDGEGRVSHGGWMRMEIYHEMS